MYGGIFKGKKNKVGEGTGESCVLFNQKNHKTHKKSML